MVVQTGVIVEVEVGIGIGFEIVDVEWVMEDQGPSLQFELPMRRASFLIWGRGLEKFRRGF
jgi:hypothetical protein